VTSPAPVADFASDAEALARMHAGESAPPRYKRRQWAELMRRAFGYDLSACAQCGSRMKLRVRLPARSPNLIAYAEPFVRSVRDECLSNVIPLGQSHLRELLRDFLAHYHRERNHQGLANRLIEPSNDNTTTGRIVRRQRIGGLLNYYSREAA
jgi:transposase InsO family protein